jgi:hypothetical protein
MLKLKINHVKVGNHLAGFIVLILFGGGGVASLRGKGVFTVRKLIPLVCVNVMEYKFVHITNYTL